MKKTKTNISVVNNAGIRRDISVHVGDTGPYPSGDILDANAVNELVNSNNAGTNASEILNQLDDVLNSKQDNILDLDTIRSGAAAGATAQLPATTLSGYGITDGYTKTEGQALESSIDERLDAQDTTISLLNGSEVIVVADHTVVATPDSQKIYREQGSTSYTDWMYQNSEWKKIAEYDFPGVDEEPTAGSVKPVQSGGVYSAVGSVMSKIVRNDVVQSMSDAQKKQLRANLGLGNGDIDAVPTIGSTRVVTSGGVAKEIAGIKNDIVPLSGFNQVSGTKIIPFESGPRGYYYDGTNVSPLPSGSSFDGFRYIKIKCKPNQRYTTVSGQARWWVSVDVNGSMDAYGENAYAITTGDNAVELWITFSTITSNDGYVVEGVAASDTSTRWENNEKIVIHTDFVSLSGKVVAEMLDGYEKGNIFSEATLVAEHKYVYVGNGVIGLQGGSNGQGYNTYRIAVDGVSTYKFTNVRFAVPVDKNNVPLVDAALAYANSINTSSYEGCAAVYWSFLYGTYPPSSYIVSRGTALTNEIIYPQWLNDFYNSKQNNKDSKVVKTGSLSNGSNILLSDARSNLTKGTRLVFECTITSGNAFSIGYSNSPNALQGKSRIFIINDTTIIYDRLGSGSTENTYTHGLTFVDGARLQVIIEQYEGSGKITLMINGTSFSQNIAVYHPTNPSVPYVLSSGLVSSDCKVTFTCVDIDKKIWVFGDSYVQFAANRWPYYLKENGYHKNILLDGFPGEGSVNAIESLKKLILLGTPKYIVWLVGMNDGTDSDINTPNTNWSSKVTTFLQLCSEHGVTPVFGTIPNVPNISHVGKNKWIKDSGYRYVDMCHAVGADVTSSWYGNMLDTSETNPVHPTAAGAKALYCQVILDLPEIMID